MNKSYQAAIAALDSEQRKAVESIEGPVLVIAGPGSGKTQVLTLRVCRILEKTQLDARNILVLTYTDSGVRALKQRLITYLGAVAPLVTVATFHGFANDLLQQFSSFLVSRGGLITETERLQLIERLVSESAEIKALKPLKKADFNISEIAKAIETLKKEAVSPERLRRAAEALEPAKTTAKNRSLELRRTKLLELAKILEIYQQKLIENERYDYDDSVLMAIKALETVSEIKAYYQERFQYLLVDEYQDSNSAQNTLVDRLMDYFAQPNIFVVGDDKQAIYRFQGASVVNMIHFKNRYPEMKIISLKNNYRSRPMIVELATKVISRNQHQIDKYLEQIKTSLVSSRSDGGKIGLFEAENHLSQYRFIASYLSHRHSEGVPYQEMAVLWRNNEEVLRATNYLQKIGLPIKARSDVVIMREPSAQALLLILKAINQPDDVISVSLALPYLKIVSLTELSSKLKLLKDSRSFIQAAKNYPELFPIAELLEELHRLSFTVTLPEFLEQILTKIEFFGRFPEQNRLRAFQTIGWLLEDIQNYTQTKDRVTLAEIIEYLEAAEKYKKKATLVLEGPDSGITVSTVHQAKGLEYDTVILAGLNEKNWRLKAKNNTIVLPPELIELPNWVDDKVEEERRLFYVGLTRAKNELVLTYSAQTATGEPTDPSIFVLETDYQAQKIVIDDTLELQEKEILSEPAEQIAERQLQAIRQLIKKTPISFTHLETYLDCPRRYLLENILRFPALPSPSLILGDAVHIALEKFHKRFMAEGKLPERSRLLEYYRYGFSRQIIISESERLLEHGLNLLGQYYDRKAADWIMPVEAEYFFSGERVFLDGIPLSGKIDKIDLIDKNKKFVRVVDYKTSSKHKSRAEIEGRTKNSDGRLKQQLVFYALLAKLDPMFPYKVAEGQISFIDDYGRFSDEVFEITATEEQQMRELIRETYHQILADNEFIDKNQQYCSICRSFNLQELG